MSEEFKQMNQKDKHLAEARLLVSAIAARRNRLKPEDIRFLESWESYLRNPYSPPISRWRIHNLRTVIVALGESEPVRERVDMFNAIEWGKNIVRFPRQDFRSAE
ncbi:MAG: hypothetical protein L0220_03685 [Acidobacteria bacterium]|nr:hypothetical protein [Acidobacteriota bacterium]